MLKHATSIGGDHMYALIRSLGSAGSAGSADAAGAAPAAAGAAGAVRGDSVSCSLAIEDASKIWSRPPRTAPFRFANSLPREGCTDASRLHEKPLAHGGACSSTVRAPGVSFTSRRSVWWALAPTCSRLWTRLAAPSGVLK